MNRTIDNIKQAFELYKKGVDAFSEANIVLSVGPASYYYEGIERYVNALFDRFAPFKEGDRVKIIKAPNTNNGWKRCEHFLIKGALGTVSEVDYRNDMFIADVIWDIETWISFDGVVTDVTKKHTFRMSENEVERIAHDAIKKT